MENLEMILHILYKRVPAQEVIEGRIRCDEFDTAEFLRMASSYVLHYSENEVSNLLNYYTNVFREDARRTGRESSDKLDVFDALLYCTKRFLCIKNNEILCRYTELLEWRKLALELGENIFVTAYMAAQVSYHEVMQQGFLWKRVIGHDNAQLNLVTGRKYSENHFHLNGSAPIFHISWISLMNNISSARMVDILASYDRDRRYTNAAYTSGYSELPFYTRAIQASLIRLLIYSRLSGTHLKIGDYYVKAGNITALFNRNLLGDAKWMISKDDAEEILSLIQETLIYEENKCTFQYIICKIFDFMERNSERYKNLAEKSSDVRGFLKKESAMRYISQRQIREMFGKIEDDTSFRDLFIMLFGKLYQINLEDVRDLFEDQERYYKIWDQITLENVQKILSNKEEIVEYLTYIQSVIDAYRMCGNALYEQEYTMDYALSELYVGNLTGNKSNFLYAGERWLMFMMFRNIYSDENFDSVWANLFYAYLLIKESIRSELVQSNKNVGFRNFQRYEQRKWDLLADSAYKNTFVKLAVSESMFTEKTERLELRISPFDSAEKNRKMILDVDNLLDPGGHTRKRFFYTLHFIKSADKNESNELYCHCRHYKKRARIEKQALAIAELREKYPIVGRRILGIDAASNEIGCRPEVFAVVYRFLQDHRCSYMTPDGMKRLPQLHSTYHVGEDFLDLADGLRAIEEAMIFLRLGSGDRLGHALALGIDPEEWYASKNYRIALPRQDYLDNIVWIYHKLVQYNINGFENFKEHIAGEFTKLFADIYTAGINRSEMDRIAELAQQENHNGVSLLSDGKEMIFNYYYAWMLRGDDPELYHLGFFDERLYLRKGNLFRINRDSFENYDIRYSPEPSLIYYMYHYNQHVRREGGLIREVQISKLYVKAVAEIQKALQKEVADKGIAIETNPSSNFLIGTFRQYEKHPILRFYNKGLIHDPAKLRECPQIQVSVNTDDQGVFNTSIENEYALLARALEALTDQDDRPLYNKYDIYDWLDQIREMGNEQSFGYLADMKEKGLYYAEEQKAVSSANTYKSVEDTGDLQEK